MLSPQTALGVGAALSPQTALGVGAALSPQTALGVGAAIAALAYDPGAGAADAKRALVLVAAVAALSLSVARSARGGGSARMNVAPASALWLGFVAWSALSLAASWSGRSSGGVATLGTWVGATGLLAASMALPQAGARRAASLAGAVIGGGSAVAAVAQYAAGARGLAIHGGHGNPNWLGLVLAIALPLSIDLALELRRAQTRSWLIAAAAASVEIPALLLSHSRVAWVAVAVALALWAVAARVFRGPHAVLAGSLAAALIAHGAIASASSAALPDDDIAPGAVDTPVATAWEGRLWIWRASADAAREALPFGEGLGGFPAAYLDAQGARLAALEPKQASRRFINATTAHCDWIEVTVDTGLPGLVLLFAAIASGIAGLLLLLPMRARSASSSGEPADATAGTTAMDPWQAGAAALLAFAVCALGDSPLHQPGAVILVALVLGASARSRRGPRRALSAISMGLLLAGAAILLAASVGAWLSVRRLTKARDALPADRIPLLASAARLDPRSGEAALALGLAHLELGDTDAALRELDRSRALFATIGTDVAIGNARMLAGDPERAVAAYSRALTRHPGYFRAHANRAEALLSLGRLDEAEAHLAIARSLWPGHPKLALLAERLRRARIEAETAEPGGSAVSP